MRTALDGWAAGRPSRYSLPPELQKLEQREGLIKLRLAHGDFGSVLLPELIFIKLGGWHFYQPSFFGPPLLSFGGTGVRTARFSVDVGGPRQAEPTRLLVDIRSDRLSLEYDDGARLYGCTVRGPARLLRYSSGRSAPRADGDYNLDLWHITNPSAFAAIKSSAELRSSRWNLQGTRELENVSYVYLTSLSAVRSEGDLRRIAMSSDGIISFRTTAASGNESVVELKVYRERTAGRTARLPVRVSTRLLAPPHLLIHRPPGDFTYYEVVAPEIYRVGVKPGANLTYSRGEVAVDAALLKPFDYIVVGDAGSPSGLKAPYDEEETKQIAHIEILNPGSDLFDFWQAHHDTDQMRGRSPEWRRLAGPA